MEIPVAESDAAKKILAGLNPDQKSAVLHDHESGAQLLILAGAGSGKTSVLTKRIQYRILCGVEPEKILALTFTAKAAAEMRERVQALFPNAGVRLCTFHSLALHMLKCKVPCLQDGTRVERPAYELLGFKKIPSPTESAERDFVQRLKDLKIKKGTVLRENLFSDEGGPLLQRKLAPLRAEVRESGQVVFEDLIFEAIHLLENFPEVQSYFQGLWSEILVDEYQDINPTQYRLVKGLLGNRKSLFVVGDDDQAIYGFRGADIGNINRFRDDFKESTLIRLEWNYRSVSTVLHLANGIFKNKPVHLRKVLRAGNPCGSKGNPLFKENRKPEIWVSDNPVEEMQKVVQSIKELRESYDLEWKNFAILVRYNRQRLYYEEALKDYGIPIAGTPIDNGEDGEVLENGVHVETVHASKGLQYAVVYYAGLSEGLTPGECIGNREQRKRQLDEERRLYYVGVTRAEAYLILLYCKRRFWKGKLRKMKRSRFLPKEASYLSTGFQMPLIFFKIYVVLVVLGYMCIQMLRVPYAKLRHGGDMTPWVDDRTQFFADFCMKMLKVDLKIENQALLGKVDWNRPVFVVGNHSSFSDIPMIFLALQRTIGFVAKESLGKVPFLHFWMIQIGCILVNRTKGGAAKAVRRAIAERGVAPRVFIFPEGTRSKDGKLGPFKSGAFHFANETDGFILPLAIKGSAAVWEERKDAKPCKVTVTILDPVDVKELKVTNPDLDPKLELCPMIRERIAKALG